jgi:hypothetical protein
MASLLVHQSEKRMGAFGMHGSQKPGQMLNNATKSCLLPAFPVFFFFLSPNAWKSLIQTIDLEVLN